MSSSDLLLTEVLDPNDPRRDEERFAEAKRKEIAGLEKRGTWTVLKNLNYRQNQTSWVVASS